VNKNVLGLKEEYKKEWNKLFRSESKEELNEKRKKYCADNRERLLEAGSQRITFEGGCTVRKDDFIRYKARYLF
jgi:hypothetical protein